LYGYCTWWIAQFCQHKYINHICSAKQEYFYRNIKYGFRLSVGCLAFPLSGLSGGACAAQGVYLMMDATQIGSATRGFEMNRRQVQLRHEPDRIGIELSSEMEAELNCYSIAVGKQRQQTCDSPHAFSESVHQ